MELENPINGGEGGDGGEGHSELESQSNGDDIDSSCSTPYVSAPSSPGRGGAGNIAAAGGYFFSAPASPMHFILSSPPYSAAAISTSFSSAGDIEFEFSARYPSSGGSAAGSMVSADEIFFNGQIRPMKLSSHLQRPQSLAPLLDLDPEEEEDEEPAMRGRDLRLRSGSIHRRTRSMSPLRNPRCQWREEEEDEPPAKGLDTEPDPKQPDTATASSSASSSRSSSGRNSKRWIFLKDLLYRSKSEGRERSITKDKFWYSISFSPSSKDKPKPSSQRSKRTTSSSSSTAPAKRPSAHERLYTTNRAQAEEMRRRTFLPYRQGLLGCLGFSSKSYGAFNGFAKTLNPVSSR
ncbi:uncharacterized protein [Typha latifolia]|uniref:uncharacterized protein n=1 Tax=Typha latifolia TaxID=4733 RepID=UPI003C2CF44C